MTLSIMTLSIMTLSIMTLSIMTLSIIMTLSMIDMLMTVCINDSQQKCTQHNNTAIMQNVVMLSVTFCLLLC
jgi:hypothetical protein